MVGAVDAAEKHGPLPGRDIDDDVVRDVGCGGFDVGQSFRLFGGGFPIGHPAVRRTGVIAAEKDVRCRVEQPFFYISFEA